MKFVELSLAVLAVIVFVGTSFAGSTEIKEIKPGIVVSLRSTNYPKRYVRHRNYLGELTEVSSELDRKDSSFIIRPGLAGGDSVSFESVNYPGYFLRHQNFMIKLNERKNKDLYRKDVSFNVRPGVNGQGFSFESVNYPGHFLRHCSFKMFIDNNKRGNNKCNADVAVYKGDVSFFVDLANYSVVSLRSTNYPKRYVRHRNYLGELTEVSSELDRKDSSFIIRPGLAGGDSVSFESVNYPGYFLRHQNFMIKLNERKNEDLYRKDASFNIRPGVNGQGFSFESVNYPGHFLRHCSFKMFIDNNNRGNNKCNADVAVYKGDVSFSIDLANHASVN